MYYTYVLWSNKLKRRYTGSTENIAIRFNKHNAGKSTYTSKGCPWIIIHKEEFQTKAEALAREKYLKSGVDRGWLDQQFPQYKHNSIL